MRIPDDPARDISSSSDRSVGRARGESSILATDLCRLPLPLAAGYWDCMLMKVLEKSCPGGVAGGVRGRVIVGWGIVFWMAIAVSIDKG